MTRPTQNCIMRYKKRIVKHVRYSMMRVIHASVRNYVTWCSLLNRTQKMDAQKDLIAPLSKQDVLCVMPTMRAMSRNAREVSSIKLFIHNVNHYMIIETLLHRPKFHDHPYDLSKHVFLHQLAVKSLGLLHDAMCIHQAFDSDKSVRFVKH